MKPIFQLPFLLLLCVLLVSLPGCNTSRTARGAAIGGAIGGVAGGAIGKKSGNTAVGILLGSAIGGTAGALIGNYMDKQAREIEQDIEGASVERVGEGILITFDSGLLFGFDSDNINSTTRQNLAELADILKKYEDTNILIEGHTDSQGTDSYNQDLSERRARSVSAVLARQGVPSSRFTVVGYGEEQPVEGNDTEAGRAANRRVEVAIYANNKLKKAAERGEAISINE